MTSLATAEETRAAEYRRQYRARTAAARAREAALTGNAAAKAALVAKTAPLIPDYQSGP